MVTELDRLVEVTANLQAHIEARAEEIAAPLIAEVTASADRRIAEVQLELRYQNDLVVELRRQCNVLERQAKTAGSDALRRASQAVPGTCHVDETRRWLTARAADLDKENGRG